MAATRRAPGCDTPSSGAAIPPLRIPVPRSPGARRGDRDVEWGGLCSRRNGGAAQPVAGGPAPVAD